MSDINQKDDQEIGPAGEKLQKVLARIGVGSRRDVESWISQGRIKVNGKDATLGLRVDMHDAITIDGKVMAVAFMANAQHMFYRKDILEANGIPVPKSYADVLAAARVGDQPRLELLDPVAIGINDGRRDALLRLVVAKDDGGDAGLGLLADQFRHLIVVEIAQAADHRRAPGNAARLRALLFIDMGNLGRRNRAAVEPTAQGTMGIAGVFLVQPVSTAFADRVELDPLD